MPKKPPARKPQHQTRQPGRESKMIPRPRVVLPEYRGSGKLAGNVAFITGDSAQPRSRQRPRIPTQGPPLKFRWADAMSETEWRTYCRAIEAVRCANIPFLLGGGFALATFTGRWRDTKDIDFYIMPETRSSAIEALNRAGFADYFERRPYDRRWIYRSVRSDVIVDIIWSMANRRALVDKLWFDRARPVVVRGEELRVVPMEEFIWCKLYILQRDHCDWTDIFNLLCSSGTQVDWKHLIQRLERDTPLLSAALSVYTWLCPRCAAELPTRLWRRLGMRPPPGENPRVLRQRVRYLDSRAWFASLQPINKKLEV